MNPNDFEDFDEEEFEMLINGLIHPGDMFVPPDMMGGAYPPPFGGGGAPAAPPAGVGGFDAMIAQAYDEADEND